VPGNAVESTARAACDLAYRPIVVSDACLADIDEGHANSLAVIKKWALSLIVSADSGQKSIGRGE
jgi:nicotinamidase-related amidase